ncbi:MAG: biotin--[acetyl-CoA-carboxylase] ligase [Hyphomicrobium sp.]
MITPNASSGLAFRIIELDEAASTNEVALRLAASGDCGPLWVSAARQTAGRGRSGRVWMSLQGNLQASLLLTPGCDVAHAAELSLVAGIAIVDAVRAAAGAPIAGLRVKWPNDILIAGAKIGGVLIESSRVRGGSTLAVVVGIGLNLASAPDDHSRPVTHLAAHGAAIDRSAMLEHLSAAMACWIEVWDNGRGFAAVRAAWLERSGPAGERMSVNTGRGSVEGRFVGLDVTGALVMADGAGREQLFTFGDVTLLAAGDSGGEPGNNGAVCAER